MLIRRIELHNVKSYEDATIIEFVPGTNAICGSNGAGKSTILESIGFVLFNYSPFRRQADMVREGEKRGEMTVVIVANDDREYEISRSIGSSSRYSVHDPELGLELAQGAANVQEWLGKHLGVGDPTRLPALFSDAIGVPQGLLAAIFLEGKPERRGKFDRLLRVDEYGKAREELLETRSFLMECLAERRNRITALETRTADLPEIEESIANLEKSIAGDEVELKTLSAEVETLHAQVERHEAQQVAIREIAGRLALLKGTRDSKRQQMEEAQRNLAAAQQAAAEMEASATGHTRHEEAGAALEQLEVQRRERDALREQYATARNSLTEVESRLTAAREQMVDIEAAQREMQQLAPALAEQESLEAELRKQTTRAAQLDQCQRAVENERAQIDDALGKLAGIDAEIAEIAGLQEVAERISALEPRLSEILDRIGSTRASLAQAHNSREAVAGGDCPFLGEPCKNIAEGTSLTDYFDGQIATLETTHKGLQSERAEVETELATARKAAGRFHTLAQLEQNRAWIDTQIREGGERLSRLEAQYSGLADARERAEEIHGRLTQLGDPRSDHARASAGAARRETVLSAISRDEGAANTLSDQLAEVAATGAKYRDLDDRIEAQRETRRQTQRDHETYLRSGALADTAPNWVTRVAAAKTELDDVDANIATAQSEYEAAVAGYDGTAHEAASEALAGARASTASITQRLQMQRETLQHRAARREELVKLVAELACQRKEQAGDESLLDFVQFARNTIGQAGPRVTKALVASISRKAGQVFSEIVNDHSMHLAWSDEYEITVEKSGNERTFQQLSGGEQMAAAIAVRLALLREVSQMDIAFFDEPTANLDEARRETLADQIVKISGFSQIFVISHDDTFERATDHLIRVYKENGVSQVESQ